MTLHEFAFAHLHLSWLSSLPFLLAAALVSSRRVSRNAATSALSHNRLQLNRAFRHAHTHKKTYSNLSSSSFPCLIILLPYDHGRWSLVEHSLILSSSLAELKERKVALKNTLICCIASFLRATAATAACQHSPRAPFVPHLHRQRKVSSQDLLIICHLQFLPLSGSLGTEEELDSFQFLSTLAAQSYQQATRPLFSLLRLYFHSMVIALKELNDRVTTAFQEHKFT